MGGTTAIYHIDGHGWYYNNINSGLPPAIVSSLAHSTYYVLCGRCPSCPLPSLEYKIENITQ